MEKSKNKITSILVALALIAVTCMAFIFSGCCGKADFELLYQEKHDVYIENCSIRVDVCVEKDKTIEFKASDFTITVEGTNYTATNFIYQYNIAGNIIEEHPTITRECKPEAMEELHVHFEGIDLYSVDLKTVNLRYQGRTLESIEHKYPVD